MPQFHVKKGTVSGGRAVLDGDEAHHARDVVRLKSGDAISLFDGEGAGYDGLITAVSRSKIEIDVTGSRTEPEGPAPRVTLAQSILPAEAMEWSVWKATELGADAVLPLLAERCVARSEKKAHWEKTALAACKQCGRLRLPRILPSAKPKDTDYALYDLILLGCLEPGSKPLAEVLGRGSRPQSALVLVGPEGDFTPEETRFFLSRGAVPVTLGRHVLKSETAAVHLLSVLKYVYGR